MKKILALTLTGLITLAGVGATVTATAVTEGSLSKETVTATQSLESIDLYLVPGTYMLDGVKVENEISSGVVKLTPEQCDEIFTENVYICTLSTGRTLPTPTSERVDKNGEKYTFNGWWAIVDATVTYFDKVPNISEDTFLYADWRADLSQRKDPVLPDPGVVVEPNHYLLITRAESGETEKITLRHKGTENSTALGLGYGYATELYNQISLKAGDKIEIYTTGLDNTTEDPVIAPLWTSSREIQLTANENKTNDTNNYLTADVGSKRRDPSLTVKEGIDGTFNIYIKFFGDGSTMEVYMEIPT